MTSHPKHTRPLFTHHHSQPKCTQILRLATPRFPRIPTPVTQNKSNLYVFTRSPILQPTNHPCHSVRFILSGARANLPPQPLKTQKKNCALSPTPSHNPPINPGTQKMGYRNFSSWGSGGGGRPPPKPSIQR